MNKQFLFAACGLAAIAPGTAVAQDAKEPEQPVQKPNVILIVGDDLGYGDLSCYGATRVQTPHVDAIAAAGTRFTNAHSTASTSTPSRYGLLTGEYPWRRSNTNILPGNAGMLIPPERFTIADMFHSAGYYTGAFGKWHLGLGSTTGAQDWNNGLDQDASDIGFDYHYLMAATSDRVPCVYIENGHIDNYDPSAPITVSYGTPIAGEPTGTKNPELMTKLKPSHGHADAIVNGIGRIGFMKGGGKALWQDETIADSIAFHAVNFIKNHKDEPFFMYFCTNDPHVPRYPHERYRGKNPMGLRGEALMQFDETVGQLTDCLKELGLLENTMIIVTSDNGAVLDDGYQDQAVQLLGDHKPWGPFRGGKYSAFSAGSTIPFIVSWPGHVPEGKVTDALYSHIDNIASLASLVGGTITANGAPDSRNRLDVLMGLNDDGAPYAAMMSNNRCVQLQIGDWRYIEPSSGTALMTEVNIETGYLGVPQLYDLSVSKYESNNVAMTEPMVAARMRSIVNQIKDGPEVELEPSMANLLLEAFEVAGGYNAGEYVVGNHPGNVTAETRNALRDAANALKKGAKNTEITNEEAQQLFDAYLEARKAADAERLANGVKTGKYYYIICHEQNRAIYENGSMMQQKTNFSRPKVGSKLPSDIKSYIWQFEPASDGKFYIKNFGSGRYNGKGTGTGSKNPIPSSSTPGDELTVSLNPVASQSAKSPVFNFALDAQVGFNRSNTSNNLLYYNGNDADIGNFWHIYEVEEEIVKELGGEVSLTEVALENHAVDVYTTTGVRVRQGAQVAHATEGLPAGVYIVGNQKQIVR